LEGTRVLIELTWVLLVFGHSPIDE